VVEIPALQGGEGVNLMSDWQLAEYATSAIVLRKPFAPRQLVDAVTAGLQPHVAV